MAGYVDTAKEHMLGSLDTLANNKAELYGVSKRVNIELCFVVSKCVQATQHVLVCYINIPSHLRQLCG